MYYDQDDNNYPVCSICGTRGKFFHMHILNDGAVSAPYCKDCCPICNDEHVKLACYDGGVE